MAQAPATRHQTDCALGRNMDCVSPRALDPLSNLARRRQSEPNDWVGRSGKRWEALGGEKLDGGAQPFQGACQRRERAHDAIDLRVPGVGGDEYSHPSVVVRSS